jgi:REP element-mobilizing transposase RayT
MTDKYNNKYRISSARLKNWDYAQNGAYYITICTKDREHYFGKIKNGEMILSDIGKLAHQFWAEIPFHFPNTYLDTFVIMPDHMHGIIVIDNPNRDMDDRGGERGGVKTLQCNVSIRKHDMSRISPKPGSISTIIRSYKSVTTKHARKINHDFGWQTRFYDHIIRNDADFNRIRQYIQNNPEKWTMDLNMKNKK